MKTRNEYRAEISQRLTTGTLALLAIWAGSVGVVLQFREVGGLYWLLAGLSGILLVVSPVLGGVGMSRLSRGVKGKVSFFNLQLVACLLGFVVFAGSASVLWWGESPTDATSADIRELRSNLEGQETLIRELQDQLAAFDSIHRLELERILDRLNGI